MKIIDMGAYITQKGEKKMYSGLIDEIKNEKKDRKKIYMTSEMEDIAARVLAETNGQASNATPIIAIAKNMGFNTFHKKLLWFLSGCIGINRKYKKKYNTDRVIFTNPKIHPYQQRFVIAHELAHFLFDYDHESKAYYNTYIKNRHAAEAEKRANAFAASLLMPRDRFRAEYEKAKNMDSSPVFITVYLSDIFKVPVKAVSKRIAEVGCRV